MAVGEKIGQGRIEVVADTRSFKNSVNALKKYMANQGKAMGAEMGEEAGQAFGREFSDSAKADMRATLDGLAKAEGKKFGKNMAKQAADKFNSDFQSRIDFGGMNVKGQQAGRQFSDGFLDEVKTGVSADLTDTLNLDLSSLRRDGASAGEEFSEGFQDTLKLELGDFDLNDTLRLDDISRDTGEGQGTLFGQGFGDGVKKAERDMDAPLRDFNKRATKQSEKSGKDSSKSFGKGFRGGLDKEMVLALTAIIAGFAELSTLASGLSAVMVSLAGALFSSIGALSTLSALLPGVAYGFALAGNALGDIPKFMPEAVAAVEDLKKSFELDTRAFADAWAPALAEFTQALADSLRFDSIGAALGEATASITQAFTNVLESPSWAAFVEAMESTVPEALTAFGAGLANVTVGLLDFFTAASPVAKQLGIDFLAWSANFAEFLRVGRETGALTAMFTSMRDVFLGLGDVLGPLIAGLSKVFLAATPSALIILDILADLTTQFNNWVTSIEGQRALQEWFDSGVVIFQALLPLIGAIADGFAMIVTPETIAATVSFLDGMTQLMPVLFGLLGVIGELGIMQVLVDLLNAVGTAIAPALPALGEMASAIGTALVGAIVALQPMLNALTPLIVKLAEGFAEWAPLILPVIEALIAGLTPVLEVVIELAIEFLDALIPLMPMLSELLVEALSAVTAMMGPMVEIFKLITPILVLLMTGGLDPLIRVLLLIAQTVLPPVTTAMRLFADIIRATKPVVDAIVDAIKGMMTPVNNLISSLGRGEDAFDAIKKAGSDMRRAIVDAVDGIVGAFKRIKWPTPPAWLQSGFNATVGKFFATGGVVNGPTRAIIGEAGPEAVIPLARPLSQVDPAVRDIAAFAQGKSPMMARGGAAGGGMTIEGGITISAPWADPRLVAIEVWDELVARSK